MVAPGEKARAMAGSMQISRPLIVTASRMTGTAAKTAQIAEVASRVGYLSEAAFSRCFTQMVGVAPGQVRLRAKQRRPIETQAAVRDAGQLKRSASLAQLSH